LTEDGFGSPDRGRAEESSGVTLPRNLSPRSAAVLRAVIDALRPRGHGFDQSIDEYVLLEIDHTLPCLPRLMRLGLPLGLRLLEWGPPLLVGRARRLTALDRQEARAYLQGWLDSRLTARRLLVHGLRALVMLAFYQHPSVLDAMGVRWDRRLVETVHLRAATLDHAKYGYPR
jgi:hypothetical protein